MDELTVERLDHVSIIVTDVDRARAFYAGVLGLAEVPRPASFDFPGAWVRVGPGGVHLLGARERADARPSVPRPRPRVLRRRARAGGGPAAGQLRFPGRLVPGGAGGHPHARRA